MPYSDDYILCMSRQASLELYRVGDKLLRRPRPDLGEKRVAELHDLRAQLALENAAEETDEVVPTPSTSPSPPVMAVNVPMNHLSEIITLQVGSRRFTTHKSTLTSESMYFQAHFGGNWQITMHDGAMFLDLNGATFEIILDYLRPEGVFPLCFSSDKGHDYAKYARIRKQADYLMIPKLAKWLDDKMYLKAVTTDTWCDAVTFKPMEHLSYPSDHHRIERIFRTTIRRVHLCPHAHHLHRDSPDMCLRAGCWTTKGKAILPPVSVDEVSDTKFDHHTVHKFHPEVLEKDYVPDEDAK